MIVDTDPVMAAAVPAVMAGGFRVLGPPPRRPRLLAVNEFVLLFFKKNIYTANLLKGSRPRSLEPQRDLNLPLTGYNGRTRWQLAFPFFYLEFIFEMNIGGLMGCHLTRSLFVGPYFGVTRPMCSRWSVGGSPVLRACVSDSVPPH